MYSFDEVANFDPDLAKAMDDELGRQRSHIELIASENLVSLKGELPGVRKASW